MNSNENIFHFSSIPKEWKIDSRCFNKTVIADEQCELGELIDYTLETANKEWQEMYDGEEDWKDLEAGVVLYNISAFVNSKGANCAVITYGRLERKKKDK